MVMRVYKHRVGNKKVFEIDGHKEVAINMSINGEAYRDWIDIEHRIGTISIKGGHVHDIISSILRFSSSTMRKHYRELLDMTDIVTGSKRLQDSDFSDADVSYEERRRKNEIEWNKKQSEDIRQFKLERILEAMENEWW